MLEHFLQGTYAYTDREFTRKREGVELPETTSRQVAQLNPQMPWETWGGLRLSACRCFFVKPDGKPVLFSTVRRVVGDFDTPVRMVTPLLSMPNGQVKNFLNACRAVGEVEEMERIAIIGSKSSQEGGLWHDFFLKYLAMFGKNVLVDFFDFAELERTRALQVGETVISAEWIPRGVEEEMLVNYSCVVDDVWTPESGPGLLKGLKVKFSKKGVGTIFLHEGEKREFSHPPIGQVRSDVCQCPTCRVIMEVTKTYEQYLFVRTMVAKLGYLAPCRGIENMGEMIVLSKYLKRLSSEPVMAINKQSDLHYLTALSEDVGIEVSGLKASRTAFPKFKAFSRFKKYSNQGQSFKQFEGKHVRFVGVDPTILESTVISTVGEVEITFVEKLDAWRVQPLSPIVYCPVDVEEVRKVIPAYSWTGLKFAQYKQYFKQQEVKVQSVRVEIPKQELEREIRSSWGGYHKIESMTMLTRRDVPKKDYRIYSMQKVNGDMKLISFQSSEWRTSVYVNPDLSWGPLKLVIETVGCQEGFMQAKAWLPWDMTVEEVLQVEERLGNSSDEERKKLSKSGAEKKIGEWMYVGRKLQRKEVVHPVSWHYFEDVNTVIVQKRRLGFHEGFKEIEKYVKHLSQLYKEE